MTLYSRNVDQHLVDFKEIHLRRQQTIMKRQRQEQELRENHPLFDTPLFIVKRDSKFRKYDVITFNNQLMMSLMTS